MASKLINKKFLKYIYILFSALALIWVVFFVTNFWNSEYKKVASKNNGIVVEVNNGLQNLPKPNVIVPSQTSGALSPTVSSYLSAQQEIKTAKDTLDSSMFLFTGFKAIKLANTNNDANKQLDLAYNTLDQSYNALIISQKFIEYNAAIDLQPIINGDEDGNDERLTRTKDGLNSIIQELDKSNINYKKDIITILQPLEAKVMDINKDNAVVWEKEVKEAQKSIIKIINDDFIGSINETSTKLLELSTNY